MKRILYVKRSLIDDSYRGNL